MSRPRIAFLIVFASCALLARGAQAGINFVGGATTNVPPHSEFMAVADLNGDQRADIIVIAPGSQEVDTFLAADTPSHFSPAQALHLGNKLRRMAVGDVNADGRQDVVIADQAADSIWILLGTGTGTFLQPLQVSIANAKRPVAVALGNFDDSGNLDIAVADDRTGKITILLNDNNNPPGFHGGGEIDVGNQPDDIRAVDLNKDGKLDLLTLNLGGPRVKEIAVMIWKRVVTGFPEFFPPQRYTIGEKPSELVLGDFNNDSVADLAMLNNPAAGNGNGEIDVLLSKGDGVLLPPTAIPVPCPFATGGAPCKSLTLAAGDFDKNGTVDLMVTLHDPRALAVVDRMQAFTGDGHGGFVGNPLFSIGKNPTSMAAGDITGDGAIDIAVANQQSLDLQAFINVSTAGGANLGDPCLTGDDCVSDRCTNGVCCADQCAADEVCAIPGREGTCVPVPPVPQDCGSPDLPDCPVDRFCVTGFCCDQQCIGGRCNVDGFFGVCFPGIPDGENCSGADDECMSGHCSKNFICCREACEADFCDNTGVCHALVPNAGACDLDEQCESNVCDAFDLICCNRKCTDDELCFPGEGICRSFTYTPMVTVAPTRTATPTPRPSPAPLGSSCSIDGDCDSTFCTDTVCCEVRSCGTDNHCAAGTGACVPGAFGTATPVPTATRQPTLPTVDPCGGCPAGQICSGNTCVFAKSSGGCSTSDDAARGNLLVVAALPLALWMTRRWRLRRVRVANRTPRQ